MTPERFDSITSRYGQLRLGLVGDFCLDRYLEIDPSRQEKSIETGLPVHNVVRVRSQPGAAGTILNNLVALGIGTIYPVGFCGIDGEGFELRRALAQKPGARLDYFLETEQRRTFTYCKPLFVVPGRSPAELSRLDSKNWSPTPDSVQDQLIADMRAAAAKVDALVVMDQVDSAETGVITRRMLAALGEISARRPELMIIADSRRSLRNYPRLTLKMNREELHALTNRGSPMTFPEICKAASDLAGQQGRAVFVTLSENGILGADPSGTIQHVTVFPIRSDIDIVGAGDAVMANLAAALAAGASTREAIELANAAASIVIHQLGTTGVANPGQLRELLFPK
ncbi:MAG: PfkB family carbohydrate kinase [Verrucomicrobia subdivision 3 bacterium]|nr:PfkB family carbohydrate kinase [Limisphaerales bacterium]